MIPSQMLKGILEGCVLAVISREETYGYEISEQLMGYGFGKSYRRNGVSVAAEAGKKRSDLCYLPGVRHGPQKKILCADGRRA